jgi:hypothetical protein
MMNNNSQVGNSTGILPLALHLGCFLITRSLSFLSRQLGTAGVQSVQTGSHPELLTVHVAG